MSKRVANRRGPSKNKGPIHRRESIARFMASNLRRDALAAGDKARADALASQNAATDRRHDRRNTELQAERAKPWNRFKRSVKAFVRRLT